MRDDVAYSGMGQSEQATNCWKIWAIIFLATTIGLGTGFGVVLQKNLSNNSAEHGYAISFYMTVDDGFNVTESSGQTYVSYPDMMIRRDILVAVDSPEDARFGGQYFTEITSVNTTYSIDSFGECYYRMRPFDEFPQNIFATQGVYVGALTTVTGLPAWAWRVTFQPHRFPINITTTIYYAQSSSMADVVPLQSITTWSDPFRGRQIVETVTYDDYATPASFNINTFFMVPQNLWCDMDVLHGGPMDHVQPAYLPRRFFADVGYHFIHKSDNMTFDAKVLMLQDFDQGLLRADAADAYSATPHIDISTFQGTYGYRVDLNTSTISCQYRNESRLFYPDTFIGSTFQYRTPFGRHETFYFTNNNWMFNNRSHTLELYMLANGYPVFIHAINNVDGNDISMYFEEFQPLMYPPSPVIFTLPSACMMLNTTSSSLSSSAPIRTSAAASHAPLQSLSPLSSFSQTVKSRRRPAPSPSSLRASAHQRLSPRV